MTKLVLLRHGQSLWNLENLFTGWTDIDLSEQGINECRTAGKLLGKEGYIFDEAHTSLLKRAIRTLWIVMEELDIMWIPVYKSWRLNERHYGSLQGLNKAATASKFGEEQVYKWRRSYDARPPELEPSDKRHPIFDPRYSLLKKDELPSTESLKDTCTRVIPYWEEFIAPAVRSGKRLIIAAHGNSIRGLIKYIENISDNDITKIEIPTGFPLIYEFDKNMKVLSSYYLGYDDKVRKSVDLVKTQLRTIKKKN